MSIVLALEFVEGVKKQLAVMNFQCWWVNT